MIFIRPAITQADREKVFEVRWLGYHKCFKDRDSVIDPYDSAENVCLFLAVNEVDEPLGTIRVLRQDRGLLELQQYVDFKLVLESNEQPCAEATRLSVPFSPHSKLVKRHLWKTYLLYCQYHQLKTMLIWIRPGAVHDYRMLLFQDCGQQGVFNHPFLHNREHHTYKLDVVNLGFRYKRENHPLYNFLFEQEHPNIRVL